MEMDSAWQKRAALALELPVEVVASYIERGRSHGATDLDRARLQILERMRMRPEKPVLRETTIVPVAMTAPAIVVASIVPSVIMPAPIVPIPFRRRHQRDFSVNPRVRARLLRLRKCCEICGSTEHLAVHHKVPRSLGGNDSDSNLLLLCYKCHFGLYHKAGRYGIHTKAIMDGDCNPPLIWGRGVQ